MAALKKESDLTRHLIGLVSTSWRSRFAGAGT
jgi:hypothetical protein